MILYTIYKALRFKILWLLVFIFLSPLVSAINRNIIPGYLNVQNGLSNNCVYSIVQDYQGLIWVGTEFGLNKFNGYDNKVYKHFRNDTTSVCGNGIHHLYEDYSKTLWIGTNAGLDHYDRDKDIFIHHPFILSQQNSYSLTIKSIFEDSQHNLFVSTSNTVFQLEKSTGILKPIEIKERKNPGAVYSIAEGYNSSLWMCNHENLIKWENGLLDDNYLFLKNPNDKEKLKSPIEIVRTKNNNYWIATENNGVHLFNPVSNTITSFHHNINDSASLANNKVRKIFLDHQENLWVSMEGGYLNVIKAKTNSIEHIEIWDSYPNSNYILSLYEDKDYNIWIGTCYKGVYLMPGISLTPFSQKQNQFFEELKEKNVTAIAEDNTGSIWIGAGQNGLFRSATVKDSLYSLNHRPKKILSDNVLTLSEDSLGNMWFGGYRSSYGIINVESEEIERYSFEECINKPSCQDVRDIYHDREGYTWIATNGDGVYVVNTFNKKVVNHLLRDEKRGNETLCNNYCLNILEDKNRNIWIGSYYGLSIYNPSIHSFKNFYHIDTDASSLSNNWVYCIYEDQEGQIWIGTQNGLNLFDPRNQTFRIFTMSDGLPNDIINGIIEDAKGRLWISTDEGVAFLDKNLLKNKSEKSLFQSFGKNEGLERLNFNQGAYEKISSGEFAFGSTDGMLLFKPDSIILKTVFPPVILTNIFLNYKRAIVGADSPLKNDVSTTSEIEISYKHSVLTFEFASIVFPQKDNCYYSCKLEGYDNEWHFIGKERKITYTKIPPGDYVFKVRSSTNNQEWSEVNERKLLISIPPPFWKTWWATLIYLLIAAYLIYLFRKYTIISVNKRNNLVLADMKNEQMQERLSFFTDISHELKTPLTLILGHIRQMVKDEEVKNKFSSQIPVIEKNSDRLLNLVDQVIDFHMIEQGDAVITNKQVNMAELFGVILDNFAPIANEKKIVLKHELPGKNFIVMTDQDKIEKILTNLISNALKYTPAKGLVIISYRITPNFIFNPHNYKKYYKVFEHDPQGEILQLIVKDSGVGIEEGDYPKIFERFYRTNTAKLNSQASAGFGIGLAYVKSLVKLCKGQIIVESEIEKGSIFNVFIPVADVLISEDKYSNEIENIGSIETQLTSDNNIVEVKESVIDEESILIVEDNFEMRSYLMKILTKYKVIEASNGYEGLRRAKETNPTLIVSDIMMPEMDGFEFCKKIKSDLYTSHIPILMLTAKSLDEDMIKSFELGADEYLKKPFNEMLLLARINNLIKSRKDLKAKFNRDYNYNFLPAVESVTSLDEVFLKNVIEAIEKNLSDSEFDIPELVRELGCSRSVLYRKIKAFTGLPVNEFVRDYKLKRAADMLTSKGVRISEIAELIGFNDVKYFARLFKSKYFMTPSEYAKKVRNEASE